MSRTHSIARVTVSVEPLQDGFQFFGSCDTRWTRGSRGRTATRGWRAEIQAGEDMVRVGKFQSDAWGMLVTRQSGHLWSNTRFGVWPFAESSPAWVGMCMRIVSTSTFTWAGWKSLSALWRTFAPVRIWPVSLLGSTLLFARRKQSKSQERQGWLGGRKPALSHAHSTQPSGLINT